MLKYILTILLSFNASAGDIFAFSGVFAYDDGVGGTHKDYDGLSPNGYFGVKYRQDNHGLSYEVGLKHESSMGYKEKGGGFNGVFFQVDFKLN